MHQEMEKIPYNDMLYSDTDSLVFKGNHLRKFKIGTKLGEWKIEVKNGEGTFFGKKGYRVNDEIRLSGVNSKGMTKEEFDKGIVKARKMKTLKGNNIEEVGSFTEETRDLREQAVNYQEWLQEIKKPIIYFDYEDKDLKYFHQKMKEFIKTKS